MRRLFVTIALGMLTGCTPVDGEQGPKTDSFGDAQVVGLAFVLSDHQVQVALAAVQRGLVSPRIEAYANQLADEQSAARDRFAAVAAQLGLQLDTSTVEAQSHITDTSEDIALIQPPVEGAQVDEVYLADSVHDVTKAVEIYDATLLPQVFNAPLRDLLVATRPLYVDEEARGRQLAADSGIVPK